MQKIWKLQKTHYAKHSHLAKKAQKMKNQKLDNPPSEKISSFHAKQTVCLIKSKCA